MKKKLIKLTESDLYNIIEGTVKSIIKESYEDDEELNYDMQQLQKAFQKQNGTYSATSSDGKFKTGDKVIVHTKKNGDIEGLIEDFGTNIMTWEEDCDIKYFDENKGKEMTMLSVPLTRIEKIG